jgi:hypothetical protein
MKTCNDCRFFRRDQHDAIPSGECCQSPSVETRWAADRPACIQFAQKHNEGDDLAWFWDQPGAGIFRSGNNQIMAHCKVGQNYVDNTDASIAAAVAGLRKIVMAKAEVKS